MTAKARDGQGRWRSMTIGVRVSPEENAEINALAALCGMKKQDYCISRMLARDIIVMGNPKVYKALKSQMEQLCLEFSRICGVGEISLEVLRALEIVAKIYEGMQQENERRGYNGKLQ